MKSLTASLIFLGLLTIFSSCGSDTAASETQNPAAAVGQEAEEERQATEDALAEKLQANIDADEHTGVVEVRDEPSPALPASPNLISEIVHEDISESPIKTQVVRRLVVPLKYGPDELQQVLTTHFEEVMELPGFEHHSRPTNVYLYAHHNDESAKSGGARWIAMLVYSRAGGQRITVNEDRIASLREEPKDRLGLDEQTRKMVFYALIAAERSASAKSKRKYPSGADWEKAYDLEEKLLATSRSELAKKYGYDEGDWNKIAGEGLRKGWPEPPR